MTCASCAARIEKQLNQLDSVEASVNLATEQASVRYDGARVSVDDLFRAVESAGYRASAGARSEPDLRDTTAARLLLAAVLTAPIVVLAMVGGLQFSGWEWVAFALATPVVFWAGWPFHRAAARNLRHRLVTMDTLISLGTLAAWTWSVVALLALEDADIYFEVAAVITTLILLGRFLESRARRRSGEALRALAKLSVPDHGLEVGDMFVVRPGERIATDGVVVEGRSAVDRSLLTGEPVPDEVGPGDEVAGGTINELGRLVARADRSARGGRPGRQGARAAPRRSGLGRFRPRRPRDLARDADGLASLYRGRDRGFDGRRRRPHHRLPLCARPRDAHRAHCRDRPRSAARDPYQRPRDPRAYPRRHHRRPRQDRDGHRGAHALR